MKIFLDSTDVAEITTLFDSYLINGITTNPSLMAKNNLTNVEFCQKIKSVISHDRFQSISLEVISTDWTDMINEVKQLYNDIISKDPELWNILYTSSSAIDKPKITIKVPLTEDGLKACYILSTEGIVIENLSDKLKFPINVTLCFSAAQALLAAKAGAAYISPFIGRLDDVGADGMQLIEEIINIYDNYNIETEVLTASIRSVQHVELAAGLGTDIATIPPKIFTAMYKHKFTDEGLQKFLEDWNKAKK